MCRERLSLPRRRSRSAPPRQMTAAIVCNIGSISAYPDIVTRVCKIRCKVKKCRKILNGRLVRFSLGRREKGNERKGTAEYARYLHFRIRRLHAEFRNVSASFLCDGYILRNFVKMPRGMWASVRHRQARALLPVRERKHAFAGKVDLAAHALVRDRLPCRRAKNPSGNRSLQKS